MSRGKRRRALKSPTTPALARSASLLGGGSVAPQGMTTVRQDWGMSQGTVGFSDKRSVHKNARRSGGSRGLDRWVERSENSAVEPRRPGLTSGGSAWRSFSHYSGEKWVKRTASPRKGSIFRAQIGGLDAL
jgi:hypothetical protein